LIVFVPFAINLVWIGLFYHSLQQASQWIREENKEGATIIAVTRCIGLLNQFIFHGAEFIGSGATEAAGRNLNADTDNLFACFAVLKAKAQNDTELGGIIDKLRLNLEARMKDIRELEPHYKAQTFVADMSNTLPENFCQNTGNDITILLAGLNEKERHFGRTMELIEIERKRIRLIATIGLICNFFIAFAIVILFKKHITSRVSILVRNAKTLADGSRRSEVVAGTDELSALNAELATVRAQLASSSAFRHTLMQMIASNIQAPLLSCGHSMERLERSGYSGDDERCRKQLRSLKMATNACMRLVDDLLLLESLETGQLHIDGQPHDIADVVASAIELLASLATIKELTLSNLVTSHIVRFDRNRIQQVLVNLLANAIKFSPAASTIKIESKIIGKRLRLSITDQGQGLEKSVRARLFQKFYQTVSGKQAGGTGLGLAISKLIVEAHGGSIGVDSTPGEGATFWFDLNN
ncbi:MAG: HAMP domain-containing histidine kinase, partial [Cyanobacteria bacterium REEB67]|nr:HAMP domain-containing histidine kinase [Cyanobacteria bacterium REEB67]